MGVIDAAVATMNQLTTMYYGRNWDAAVATMNQLTMYYGRRCSGGDDESTNDNVLWA